MQNMMGPPPGASKTEIKEYERLKKIATDPTAILAELKSGKISPAMVLALKTMYPATHAEIVKETNDMLIKNRAKGKDLPYAQRLAVGTLIPGAEPSLDPSYVRTIQGLYNKNKMATPPPPVAKTGQRSDASNTRISMREPRET